MKWVQFAKNNPVIVLDIVKYGLAVLALFGLSLPAGAGLALSGLIVAVLSLVTRSLVTPVNSAGE